MKFRLLHKFVAVMALISVLPMALLGLRLINLGQLGVRTAILELHLTTADKIASEFNAYLRSADAGLRSAINAMGQMDWENKQTMLAALLETRREIKQISVLFKGGPGEGEGGAERNPRGPTASRRPGRGSATSRSIRRPTWRSFIIPSGKIWRCAPNWTSPLSSIPST